MGKYLYMLFIGCLMVFFTATPVLAGEFNDVVMSMDYGIPNSPPEIHPPLIRFEQAIFIANYSEEIQEIYPIPVDVLIPRPGWKSESAIESYIRYQKGNLAEYHKN